jgi:hypothetical protein
MKQYFKPLTIFTFIFIFIWYIYNYFWGDLIPINDGYGWDGKTYGEFAISIENIKQGPFYYSGRIFPSFMVYLIHTTLNITPSKENILNIFYIYNIFIVFLGILGFFMIAKKQNWNYSVFIIGFSAIFINFPLLRLMPFNPPFTTDYTALVLGIYILYFYVSDKTYAVITLSIIGAFTYPLILLASTLLLVFGKITNNKQQTTNPISEKLTHTFKFISTKLKMFFIIASIVSIPVYLLFYYFVLIPKNLEGFTFRIVQSHPIIIHIISLICVFYYLYFIFKEIFKLELNIHIFIKHLIFFLILFGIIYLVKRAISDETVKGPMGLKLFLFHIITQAINYPFGYLLSHCLYYGTAVFLIVAFREKIFTNANRISTGYLLLITMYFLLSIGTESRQFIYSIPFFIFLLCNYLNTIEFDIKISYYIYATSMILSKIWLPFDLTSWSNSAYDVDPAQFPYQFYFMTMGPWMIDLTFLIQALVMTLLYLIFYFYFKKLIKVN